MRDMEQQMLDLKDEPGFGIDLGPNFDADVMEAANRIADEVDKAAAQQRTYTVSTLNRDAAAAERAIGRMFPKTDPIVNPVKLIERKILDEAVKGGSAKQYTTGKGKQKLRKMAEAFWREQIRRDPEIMGGANGIIANAINPGMTGWAWNKDYTPANFADPFNPSRTDQMLHWASHQDWWLNEKILINGQTLVSMLRTMIDAFRAGHMRRDRFQANIRDIVAMGVKGSIELKGQEASNVPEAGGEAAPRD